MKIYHQNMVYHQNFFVYGHRGVPSLLDENTLESFEKAIELNYDGVELDVVITKDGRLVINHDISLKKNNQSSLISDLNYDQIKFFKLPLLEDVLSIIGHKTKINIEIKNQGKISFKTTYKVIETLKKLNLIDNIIISSFSPLIIKKSKEIDDRFPTAWIWGKNNIIFFNSFNWVLRYFKPNAIHINYQLVNKKLVKKIQKKGLKILAYTVNCKDALIDMIESNVDGVFTDYPEIMKLSKNQAD